MAETILVSEIFGPTVQGEGPLIGQPTAFVRTGGCDYRCAWCDTLYAVLPEYRGDWLPMSAAEVFARVEDISGARPLLISLSGGNPALQPLGPLIALGHAKGYRFALETQGSVAKPWFARLDWLVLSPKPPSSGMATDWAALARCFAAAGNGPRCALKVVVFDEADYAFAREVARRHPQTPITLQVGNPCPPDPDGTPGADADPGDLLARFRWLAGRVAEDRWFEARVLPQLHVLAWGNQRGV
ncbi:MAG: 7-carboxy-7-deazaguanine synthase QueE [Kiloniellaceae bacterium]